MLRPKLIGLTGHSRAGKDTFFSLLQVLSQVKVRRYAFADRLKEDLSNLSFEMFGKPAADLTGAEKENFRPILIAYGCAWRAIDPDHWVKVVDKQIEWDGAMLFSSHETATVPIITDVRFLNEYAFFRAKYGEAFVLIDIAREGIPTPPAEELRNQPALTKVADYTISWPTLLPDRQSELAGYAKKFVDSYGLA